MDPLVEVRQWILIAMNVFLREGGWRSAKSLYLIGAFARDEGTYRRINGQLRIYNDLDFLVVVPYKTPRRMLSLNRIHRKLNDGRFSCSIDLLVVSQRELQDPPPIILHYDIQQSHEWLWGERLLGKELCRILPKDSLSRSDAVQLLLNRLASLIIGLSMLQQKTFDDCYLQVQLSKPLLAMMAAMQVKARCYQVSVKDQLAWAKQQWQDAKLLNLMDTAVQFRHDPQLEHFQPYKQTASTIAKYYFTFLKDYISGHYGTSPDSLESLIVAMRAAQPRQWDMLSPSWWASRLRAARIEVKVRRPTYGPHPQVDVYESLLRWMAQYLDNPELINIDDTKLLINLWKVSGYDCAIK